MSFTVVVLQQPPPPTIPTLASPKYLRDLCDLCHLCGLCDLRGLCDLCNLCTARTTCRTVPPATRPFKRVDVSNVSFAHAVKVHGVQYHVMFGGLVFQDLHIFTDKLFEHSIVIRPNC